MVFVFIHLLTMKEEGRNETCVFNYRSQQMGPAKSTVVDVG